MANKTFLMHNSGLKGIDLPQYPPEAWDWYSEKPDDDKINLYASVAAVFRVANMTADATASVPFVLLDESDEEYDTSANWKNKVGWLSNPKELLRLWRLSLFMTNSAYGFKEMNRVAITDLKYIVPTTITPIVDKTGYTGLKAFKRTLGTNSATYQYMPDKPMANPILYFFRRDHTTELLPSKNTEFKALMNAAGVLYYQDWFVKKFFERGGIKPSMLMLKGVTDKTVIEKIENVWDKVVRGFYKYLGKVFQGMHDDQGLEVVPIGEGIENLKDSTMHREKIEDIAMAAGMPLSLLLANSANYATAKTEYASWFNNSIVPWVDWMGEILNEQLFKPIGLRIDFRPEVTNEGTNEEQERAGAFRAYVASGVRPSIAAQILGIEMPPNMEYDALDENYGYMLEMPDVGGGGSEVPVAETEEDDESETVPEKSAPAVNTELTLDQLSELDLWRNIAFRKLKRGESMPTDWVAKHITEDTASAIRKRLQGCKTEDEVRDAFDMTKERDSDLVALARSLDRAVEAVNATKPEPQEDEDNDEFMERCIPEVLEDGTAQDNEQAIAE